MGITGDAGGYIALVDEFPLIKDRLLATLLFQNIDRAVVNEYAQRGMAGDHKDDYTLLDMSLVRTSQAALTLTFWERRINLDLSHEEFEYAIDAIRSPNGDLIDDMDSNFISTEKHTRAMLSLDMTDHHLDPRRGFRVSATYTDQPPQSSKEPNFYLLNYNLRWYIPTVGRDTLALNYFQSDAHVRSTGDTNQTNIDAELDISCSPTDTQCLQAEQELIANFVKRRTYGTAVTLGGNERLRSYPMGRFQGGHTAFIGAEYRWIFKHDIAPFNYLFWKDVRSDIQLAFFAESATVAETSSALWDESRSTVGLGIRLVADSGSIYRADLAYGDEGTELIVFFFYPWEDSL